MVAAADWIRTITPPKNFEKSGSQSRLPLRHVGALLTKCMKWTCTCIRFVCCKECQNAIQFDNEVSARQENELLPGYGLISGTPISVLKPSTHYESLHRFSVLLHPLSKLLFTTSTPDWALIARRQMGTEDDNTTSSARDMKGKGKMVQTPGAYNGAQPSIYWNFTLSQSICVPFTYVWRSDCMSSNIFCDKSLSDSSW